jgi:cbb3-type cytochrome c oxidase subunit II
MSWRTAALASLLLLGCSSHRVPDAPEPARALVPLTRAEGQLLSPLALAGRDVFVREGCFVCHGVAPDTARSTLPEEEQVPVPAQPSGPAGPDLAGVGDKYPHLWHVHHLRDPRTVTPGSIMPRFEGVLDGPIAPGVPSRVATLSTRVGVPLDEAAARVAIEQESAAIAEGVREQGGEVTAASELVALIAYLQQLDRRPPVEVPSALDPGPLDATLAADAQALAEEGAAVFGRYCVPCHGEKAEGRIGPRLTDDEWLHGGRPSDVWRSVAHGHTAKGMPAWGAVLNDQQVRAVTVFVVGRRAP